MSIAVSALRMTVLGLGALIVGLSGVGYIKAAEQPSVDAFATWLGRG